MITEEKRSYEVSLWTLQDEFITVLKWSDVEQQGRIQEPQMTLNVDGTRNFNFSIPMYLYQYTDSPEPHMEKRENPIWYNTRNGNLIASMRKIKVIFNKGKTLLPTIQGNCILLEDLLNNNNLKSTIDWRAIWKEAYIPLGYYGNVDLWNRKIIAPSAFTNASYNFSGTYGTIYSSALTVGNIVVVYTPITASGTVKTAAQMNTYVTSLGNTMDDILANDADADNLVLACFPKDDYGSVAAAIQAANAFSKNLHNIQAEWDIIRYYNNWFGESNIDSNQIFTTVLNSTHFSYYNTAEKSKNTFEFLITKVTEVHEKDELTCRVETEGLAFNELGKIGYKYTLNMDEVELDEKKLQKTQGIDAQIHTTVDYWAKKIHLKPYIMTDVGGDPNIWQYTVLMNWDSFSARGIHRFNNKVYEEEYASSWKVSNNTILPKTVENCREKERIIDSKESNIYNITQTIAETFEIFCRYEYGYDENYHIISKKVIFYNNFISEDEGFLSINYPYTAQSIQRNMDSTNLTTKLYVQSSDTDDTIMGSNSISLSNANKTKEDYLLDFDYIHRIKGINDEQYAAIKDYETAILNHNNTIIPLQEQSNAIQKKLIDLKAQQKIAEESIELDNKQTDLYKKKLEAYDKIDQMVDGKISITETAPKLKVLITEDAENHLYSLNLGDQDKGIDPGSVNVFSTWNSASGKCFGQFVDYVPKFSNEDNILIGLEHLRYAPTTFNASDIADGGANRMAWALSADPNTPPMGGWTDVTTFPAASTFNDQKSTTPFYWKNNYTVYKNGYIHNVYSMECLDNETAVALNVKRYVVEKKPIYYYKDDDTPPTVPTEEISTTSTNKNVWTTGLRNYESGVRCFITYQYKYRTFIVEENLDDDTQEVSAPPTITSSSEEELGWSPSTPIIDSKYNAQPSSSYVYVTYDYFPKLYYDKLIQYWADKADADSAKSQSLLQTIGNDETNPKTGLYLEYDTVTAQLEAALAAKQETIRKFEQMMGPALREGYWTPEDYDDYGDSYSASRAFGNSYGTDAAPAADSTEAIISWDGLLFDDEIDYYYEQGANQEKINYPCINLSTVYGSVANALSGIKTLLQEKETGKGTPGFIYSDSNCRQISGSVVTIDNNSMPNTMTNNVRDPKYVRLFALGSEAIPAFGVYNNSVVPILILTGAKMLPDNAITNMKAITSKGGNPVIGLFKYTQNGGKITVNISNSKNVANESNVWITPTKIVYPRIRIRSDNIQTTENKLFISYGNSDILTNNEDYKVAFRTNTTNNVYYTETCITLKNEVLFNNGDLNSLVTVKYTLSNANTVIYLDAIKVLKENSVPKAAYEVRVNVMNESLMKNLYRRLTQILMINDAELKFENVFGYISQVELNLDQPQEDKMEVKNYKTKFEDLFSTIVAQTEEMKKNAGAYAAAAAGQVGLTPEAMEETLSRNSNIFDAYMESGFDDSRVVQARINSIAKDIGLILGAANESLDRLYGLTLENANLLSGFVENIAADLTPHIYYGTTPPDKARTGDIFYQTDPETGEVIGNWLGNTNGGYTKTFDGKLSQITGATMNVDANKGIIEILAGTKIDMKTGGDLYIAAKENINIVGNKSVNIGGGSINIAALATANQGISIVAVEEGEALIASKVYELLLSKIKKPTNYVETDFTNSNGQNRGFKNALDSTKSTNGNNYRFNFGDGVIYEVAKTSLENSGTFSYVKAYKWLSQKVTTTSLVDIKPKQIMMKSSNLIMKASSKILLVTSDGTMDGTSALQLSPSEGIFMGSGKGITLFAGKTIGNNGALINYDDANQKISLKSGTVLGSTFQLKPDYLIFGTAQLTSDTNTAMGTVMEITKDHLVFGTNDGPLKVYNTTGNGHMIGDLENRPSLNISYKTSITGMEITRAQFGLATLTSYNTTYNIGNLLFMNNEGLLLGSVLIKKSDEQPYSPTTQNAVAPSDEDTLTNNMYTQGSYIAITPSILEIGSLSNLYINTNNFKLQTDSYKVENGKIVGKTTLDNTIMAIGKNLQNITADTKVVNGKFTDSDEEHAYENQPNVNLVLNKNGLYVKGTVYADNGKFHGAIEATSLNAVNPNMDAELQKLLSGNIQEQIDDEIQTWTGKGTPVPFGKRTGTNNGENWDNSYTKTDLTTNTNHVNHSEWDEFTKSSATEEAKGQHVGDIYYDIATEAESATAGSMYRWIKNNEDYYWISVGDTVSTKTLELIANARTDLESIFVLGRPLGNYFDDDLIYGANLNTRNGLLIMGNESSNGTIGIFRANHTTMGFFNMEADDVSKSFAYNSTDGLHISSESNFTRDADALLYYKDGNMYISGTLFADDIRVKNRNETGNGVTFNEYLSSNATNLVDDYLSASDYYKLLQGNFDGWDTEHNSGQTFWSNLQSRWNALDGGTASTITVQSLNTKASNIINGNTGLAFTGASSTDNITGAQLNKATGLLITGYIDKNDTSKGTMYLKVTHGAMGFFKKVNNTETAMMYFENGDMALKGTMYAKTGWFGGEHGWVIKTNELRSYDYATVNGQEIPQVMLKTKESAGSGATTAIFQLADSSGNVRLLFKNGQLELSGTITAVGGYLGTETNGWIIGTDTYNNTDVGRIQSANGKLILSAGTADSSQHPFILLKDNNNNTVFKAQQGEVEITGTIHASGGWFGTEDGWVIGGNLATAKTITTIMSASGIPASTSSQTGSRIQSVNNKVILNAGSSSTEPYIIMRKDGANGTLEDVFEYYNGNIAIKGAITATAFSLTDDADVDLSEFTGMVTTNWGRDYYDTNGTTKKFLTLKTGTNEIDGGILLDSTRSLIVPWQYNNDFQTPAFIINQDGLQYRHMQPIYTNNKVTGAIADYNETGVSDFTVNGDGITLRGNSIAIYGGHVSVNGENVWERGDILYGENEPAVHPSGGWIWIRPNPNYQTVLTFSSFDNNVANNKTATITPIAESQKLTTTQITYTVTAKIEFTSNLDGNFTATIMLVGYNSAGGQTGVISGSINYGNIYQGQIGTHMGSFVNIVDLTQDSGGNILSSTTTRIVATVAGNRTPFTVHSVTVEAAIPQVASNSRVLCDVYYYPPST